MRFYACIWLYISIILLFGNVSGGKSAKSVHTGMIELGIAPDLSQLLPDEEPPNLYDYTEPLVTHATTLENFPNPLTNPKDCNRIHISESYICDPDRLLTETEADRLEEILSLQRQKSEHYCEGFGQVPYRFGVAIINWLPKEDMSTLGDELLKRWRLDHDKCNDGILMLVVAHQKDIVIKWSKGVEPLINAKVVSSIYPVCRHLLATEKLALAVDECMSFIIKRVTRVVLPTNETPQKLLTLVIASLVGFAFTAITISVLADTDDESAPRPPPAPSSNSAAPQQPQGTQLETREAAN